MRKNNISEEVKDKIFREYITTRKQIKIIAEENNISYEQAISILEEYRQKHKTEEFRNNFGYQDLVDNTCRQEIFEDMGPKGREKKISFKDKFGEEIYKLRKRGLTHKEITEVLCKRGDKISQTEVRRISGIVFFEKGEEEPKKTYTLKEREEQEKKIAKMIVKLVETRKATVEQMKKMAKYYRIDFKKIMEQLEDREKM